jgi:deazaflavin-dependent oxidoreductase (nitroreductase family)
MMILYGDRMSDRVEANRKVIEEFRANGGQVSGQFAGTPLVLLTHTGARSGRRYTSPVAYLADGDRLVVFGANGGRPTHPGWYHNLVANPAVTVEVGTQTLDMLATLLDGDERERLWREQVRRFPFFADLETRSGRRMPVVGLLRGPG